MKNLSNRTEELIARLYLQLLAREEGAETVEYVAMGVVVVVLLAAIMTAFSGEGESIGSAFVQSLVSWAQNIGGGG